jgi:hypothetical protein
MEDQYADLTNLAQNVQVGTLAVGETGLQLIRYGAGEARITGAVRTDGIFRGLGGLFAGSFTTTQRDAIAAGSRPYGLLITNTSTNRLEWNSNTDVSPTWQPAAADGSGNVSVPGQVISRAGLAASQVIIGSSGTSPTISFGTAGDTTIYKSASKVLTVDSEFHSLRASVTDRILSGNISTDTANRFQIDASGTFLWGPGATTAPTVQLNYVTGGLSTNGTFTATGAIASSATVMAVSGGGTAQGWLGSISGLATLFLGSDAAYYIERDSANSRLYINSGIYAAGAITGTANYFNRNAVATYYFGTGDDMYFQRDGANNRIQVGTNLYIPGTTLSGNTVSSNIEIIARTGSQYQTIIGYTGSTAGGVDFGNPASAFIRQSAVGSSIIGIYYSQTIEQYLTVHPYDDGANFTAAINRSTGIPGSTFSCGSSGSNNGQGAQLTATGVWTNGSSGANKENFETFGKHLMHDDVLDKIVQLPLHRYNYKVSDEPELLLPDKPKRLRGMSKDDHSLALDRHSLEIKQRKAAHTEYLKRHRSEQKMIARAKHYGPTAEDFYELFPNGYDDKTIAASDLAGVALMGVQALAARISVLEARIS